MSIYKELSYDAEIDVVKGIQFSVLSPDEILRRSVVEIVTNEGFVGNKPVDGGLFDSRMGVLEHNQKCSTCDQTNIFCPGHFAHIKLARPVFHAMFFDRTIKLLKCLCHRCSKPLVMPIETPSGQQQQKQQDELKKAIAIKNLQKRFDAIYKIINPSNTSTTKGIRCGDGNVDGCGARQPKIIKENMMRLVAVWRSETGDKKDETRKDVSPEDVLRIFQRMSERDMEMLGFNPQWNRPEWMICTVLPVPPPAVRPSIIEDNGRREDDLTHKLSDIIKYNQQLKQKIESGNANQDHFNTLSMLLQIHIATFLNNQIPGVPAAQQRNGRKLKSIADRLKKKEGRIRGNLNGKRVDQSARSVITPDPYISIDELGVPIKIAMNLTFPEIVNDNNIEEMQKLVRNGPDTWPGAKYLRLHQKHTIRLKNADREKIASEIQPGDIVDRHLRDGDYVLFNRQPSLHKMSMMCHRVKVMPYQTFRLNPSVCSPYNADFDGDEMNVHMPQSVQTMCELMDFASVPYHIITPKDGEPIMEIIQDTMTGAFRLTKDNVRIQDKVFANLQMVNSYFDGRLPTPRDAKNHLYDGRQAYSIILPPSFYLETKNNQEVKIRELDENGKIIERKDTEKVIIKNSELISGTLDKWTFNSMSRGIIPVLFHDYGPFEIQRFLDNTQRLICRWLVTSGFSVGISDLVTDEKTGKALKDAVASMKTKAYKIIEDARRGKLENKTIFTNADNFERELLNILNEANSTAGSISLKEINDITNRMINMVKSGAKGKKSNVAQMIALVGQQNIEGKRVGYGFTDRTLPHFTKYDDGPEARGFVENSFISGLSPQEVFFHAMSGREGLIDTAVKSVTRETGIVIIENGISKMVEIGDWIDEHMERCKDRVQHKEEKNTEVLELDSEVLIPNMDSTGHMLWSKMKYVTRHDPDNELYEVTTHGGRKVIVTQYDSMLVWNPEKQEFLKKPTTDIKIGEFVPVTSKLPAPPVILNQVDVSRYLLKSEHIYGTDFWMASKMMKEHMDGRTHAYPRWWKQHNGTDFTLPYPSKARLQRVMVRSDLDAIKERCVYNYAATRGACSIPDTFPLDKEFGTFIGLYLAEGCCHVKAGKVSIANTDPKVKAFVKAWFDKYDIKNWEETREIDIKNADRLVVSRSTTCSVEGNSTMLAKFLDRFVGHGAAHKFVPNEAFAAPEEFIIGILNGYFAGDGCVGVNDICASSASEKLIHGIGILCNRIGVFGKIYKIQAKKNNLGMKTILPSYRLDIRSRFAERMRTKVDFIIDYKNERLKNMQCSMSHRNFPEENDVVMDSIKSVTPIDVANHPKVYDVTVPGTYNFLISSGLNMRDTSETGYIQRRLVKAMEDCKIYYDQTVRNAGGSIVQFIYGEDGMEGTKVEKQYIPTIELDLIELDTKYHLRPDDALQIHIHPEAFKRMSGDKEWMKRCSEHFKQIVEDREYLITNIFQGEKENKIIYPIPFDRILKNARARISDAGLDGVPSDLTPAEILDEIDRLSEKLYINVPKQGTRFLEILLRIHLSPKPMIMKYHMTKEVFKWIVDEIERRYYEAIAHAGEMVGIVAAQSMGEPATQLSVTKNTKIRIIHGKNIDTSSYNGEIGNFIDNLMKKHKNEVIDIGNNSSALYLKDDYYIIGVSNDEKTSWKRILEVSRHPANGGMVTVKTRSGRKTTATLSHSFLKRTNNGIEPVEGGKLKIGDRIPVAYNIPEIENPLKIIEIDSKDFALDRDFGWIIGAYLADGNATSNVSISKNEGIFEDKIRRFSIENGYTVNIRYTEGTINIQHPSYSDRVYTSKKITIGGNGSYRLAQWFVHNFGTGSYNKTLPAWVFASNKDFVAGIVSGYFDGDGNVNCDKQMIRCHSVCESLIDNMSVLLAYCGIFAVKLLETRKRDKANVFHVLSISSKYANRFREVVGFETPHKKENLDKIIAYNERENRHSDQEMIDMIPECGESIFYVGKRLKLPGQSRLYRRWLKKEAIDRRTLEKYVNLFKAANDLAGNLPDVKAHISKLEIALKGHVVWDEIVELEYSPDPKEYVYDFTVPGNNSFMVDNCVLVHNTLDSFHSSGTAAAVKATSGVPRLKELLSVTKNIKTPTLRIHFKKDIGTVVNPPENKESNDENNPVFIAKNKVKTLMHKFEMTRISDILEMSEIFWDPPGDNGLYTGIQDDNGLLELYRIFQRVNPDECYSRSPWVLRMRLNKERMHAQNLTMLDVYTNIEKTHGDAIECIFSDDNADELIFRIRIMDAKIKDIDTDDAVAALKAVEFNIVNNVILKGIDGIKKGSLRMLESTRYDPETMSFNQVAEWIMDTDGTNLEAFLSNPNIDKTRTVSNDVCEIYKTLGIEAARTALYNEIMEVIRESSVNYRHIALLIDTITNRGTLMSVDRHGINRGDVGPLAKSSFEETTNMLIDASIFSELDKINGVSANIMLGQLPPCGTGDSEVLLDEDRFEELLKEMPKRQVAQVDEEKEQIVFQEPCRPQNIAFDFEMPTSSKNVSKMPEPRINFV